MRTERALKLRLNQAKNRLEYSRGNDTEILLGEINLLEWILNLDKRSMYLKRLADKNKQV